MKIKQIKLERSPLNQFDLLGADEVGLSKAFAYVLGREPIALYSFLQYIGIPTKNTRSNFKATSIEIERVRDEGRTDIEIRQKGKLHVIVECKVRSNKVQSQRTRYLKSFHDDRKKVLCFITQQNDFKKQVDETIEIHNLGWMDIANLFDNKQFQDYPLIKDFLSFVMKGFKMREQKEILVQDLGKPAEIRRFREFQVYRRDVIFGSPFYFSPYFTRKAKQTEGEGISYLSKILGILTLSPEVIENFTDDLNKFTDDPELVKNWIRGVKLLSEEKDKTFTYFFLEKPLKLNTPLRKDGTTKKGRGKDWIAAMIPKNRCVTFSEFTRRLIQANSS